MDAPNQPKKRNYTLPASLPEDEFLPKDKRGYPNRSYLGHTSEIIPTPWANEGGFVEVGQPKRFPPARKRTREQDKERIRLSKIENPGRCQARMIRYDGWCRKNKINGLEVCFKHGGQYRASKKAAERRYKQQLLEERATKIINSVK